MSQITQKGATGPLALQANGTFQTSNDTSLTALCGTRWDLADGREVMLVLTTAGTTTTSGLLYQDPAVVANHQNLTVTAVQAYSSNGNIPATVTVTLGATAMFANQYQGGFVHVNNGPGIGQSLRIASHPGAAASGTGVVITLEDAPNVALTTSSTVDLVFQHGVGVIVSPTAQTNALVGVALYPISGANYGFLLTKGVTAVVADASAPAAGISIQPSAVTAGTVQTAGGTGAVVGYTTQAATSAQARGAFINL